MISLRLRKSYKFPLVPTACLVLLRRVWCYAISASLTSWRPRLTTLFAKRAGEAAGFDPAFADTAVATTSSVTNHHGFLSLTAWQCLQLPGQGPLRTVCCLVLMFLSFLLPLWWHGLQLPGILLSVRWYRLRLPGRGWPRVCWTLVSLWVRLLMQLSCSGQRFGFPEACTATASKMATAGPSRFPDAFNQGQVCELSTNFHDTEVLMPMTTLSSFVLPGPMSEAARCGLAP